MGAFGWKHQIVGEGIDCGGGLCISLVVWGDGRRYLSGVPSWEIRRIGYVTFKLELPSTLAKVDKTGYCGTAFGTVTPAFACFDDLANRRRASYVHCGQTHFET